MGNGLCKRLWWKRNVRIVFIGLNTSGKSTSVFRLKLGEVESLSTIELNDGWMVKNNNSFVHLALWPGGGREKMGAISMFYASNTRGLVYYFDSSKRDLFKEVEHEIELYAYDDEKYEVPVLVLATKQELPGAISVKEIRNKLAPLFRKRTWAVFGVSVTTHDKRNNDTGLKEAFDWLTDAIVTKETYREIEKWLPEELKEVDADEKEEKEQESKLYHSLVRRGMSMG